MKVIANVYKLINWFFNKPKTSGILVFVSLSLIFTYIAFQQNEIDKENKKVEMRNTLNVVSQNIDQTLKNCYTTTLSLALTINEEGIPQDFNSIGQRLLKSNNSINAVQMVPNGVIKYIYPMKGNETAMNLDILSSKLFQKEALKSIENQKMYFAGPFELTQGGQGIVGRLPVYLKNKFWGFSAVVIRLDKLLITSGINSVNNEKYEFQLSKKNPITQKEDFFLPETIKRTKHNYVYNYIPDGDWNLYLIDKRNNTLFQKLIFNIILGLLLAFIFGFFTILLLKKPELLQKLVHEQTNKLINSELKFKTIFEQAAVGIANVDLKTGKFIEINEKFCSLLGYTQSEMKSKDFQSITHPDDLHVDVQNVKKIKKGILNQYSLEKRYFKKNGEIIWVKLNVAPLLLTGNVINETSAISIVEDITLKKEQESLIKRNEDHFKSLFEDSPLPLREEDFSKVKLYLEKTNLMGQNIEIIRDYFNNNPTEVNKVHSLIIHNNANKACLKLFKVNNNEELVKSKSNLFNDISFNDFKDQIIAITQGNSEYAIDTIIKNSENEISNIDLRWNVVRGYENSLGRIIVSNEDITERKTAEKIILNSQERIESLINTIDGIVWECDANTFEFTFISKKVKNILGYTAEEWLFCKTFWQDHIHPEDKESVISFCSEKTENNEDHDFEYRMVAKDGSVVWLRDIVNIVLENNKSVSLRGIMINITRHKENQKDLKKSFNLVSEQNKRLLNFSYIVSHNLRSHTSNISSLIGLIETAENNDEKEEMIGLLKSVSNSLNDTMTNLNEVVNIQTNITLSIEKINLYKYIKKAKKILSGQIVSNSITFNNLVAADVEINYNPAYMESILYNIISNAIRYSNKDRDSFITIKYYKENESKILEITDNGIGIDLEKYKNKIFGMYKTFSNYKDSKGLGLFITKNQVEAMGGKITVQSELNVGTTFKIYIL